MIRPMGSYLFQSQPQYNRYTLQQPVSVHYIDPGVVVSPTLLPNVCNFNCKGVRKTLAPLMSIYETKIWIWTFGYERRWKEAKCYAHEFERNSIDGQKLPMLTEEDLVRMSIRNNHRETILEKIKELFPVCTLSDISSVRSYWIKEMEESSSDGLDERQCSEGMAFSSRSSESALSMSCPVERLCLEGVELSSSSSRSSASALSMSCPVEGQCLEGVELSSSSSLLSQSKDCPVNFSKSLSLPSQSMEWSLNQQSEK